MRTRYARLHRGRTRCNECVNWNAHRAWFRGCTGNDFWPGLCCPSVDHSFFFVGSTVRSTPPSKAIIGRDSTPTPSRVQIYHRLLPVFSAALPAAVFVAKLSSFLAAFFEPLAAVLGTEIDHIRKKYLASLTGPIPVDFVIGICVQRRKKHGRRREHAKKTLFMRVVCGTVRVVSE